MLNKYITHNIIAEHLEITLIKYNFSVYIPPQDILIPSFFHFLISCCMGSFFYICFSESTLS